MKAAGFGTTLVLAGVVLLLAVPRINSELSFVGGFVLVAAMLIFLPWAVYTLVRIAIRPLERRSRAIRLAIWSVTLVASFAARAQWDVAAHEEATAAVSAVQVHKGRTGKYPASLSEAGLDAEALKKKYSLSYRLEDGKPKLFYSQPSMPTVAKHYDFEGNSWSELH